MFRGYNPTYNWWVPWHLTLPLKDAKDEKDGRFCGKEGAN